ncbi:nuclear transport factor 2 family protein [Thermodesulfobacteriota bacterium]
MDKETLLEYCRIYNSGDYKKAISTYYAEDAVFEASDYRVEGRDNIIEFLSEGHTGLTEVMEFTNILIEGDRIAVELEAEFTAMEDKPDSHIRALKKGDSFKLKMSSFYKVKDEKISHIRIYRFTKWSQ